MNNIKSISNIYKKMSTCGKILIFVALFLIIVVFFRFINNEASKKKKKEGFQEFNFLNNNDNGYNQSNDMYTTNFNFVKGPDVYDDFYASIYDQLLFSSFKTNYEVTQLVKETNPTEKSVILDVGSGTGHHVAKLAEKGYNVVGIDKSEAMVRQAQQNYPEYTFLKADAYDSSSLANNSFTHILCLYFTIYYFQDKIRFFNNCFDWLMPGGTLIVHLVDRARFDPILPSGNPLYIVSPQKYAKERITKTKVIFDEFTYSSNFKLNEGENIAIFDEKFKFNNGKTRRQEQELFMESTTDILTQAQESGFLIQGQIDLVKCAYEYQYLYILVKPE
jgi:SAM-dependent methyltransferase